MNEAKDVSINNASHQTVTFQAKWSGGEGPVQRVMSNGLSRLDMRGAPNGTTVTIEIQGWQSFQFKFKNDGNHGDLKLSSGGGIQWTSM